MIEREIKHFHVFAGLGGGALGFNRGRAELNGIRAKFRCLGGVDVSAAAMRDFQRLAGVKGTVMDLFDREQYKAFHDAEPPLHWREATPQDIQAAAGHERPNIVFLSAPCKGFSGLLSETRSKTGKYQALNRLTLRGIWLMLEAWANDPPELVIFENVPRIATRGRALLDQIVTLLRHYGYAVAETFHDCGEIGGLAQSRKRYLMVARHMEKVPPFLYEPSKRNLKAVGQILEKFPMPGNIAGGPMHSIPNLQWKTWVRLAFVEAGKDWRSLNKLNVVDGKLKDYLLVPELRNDNLGVTGWTEPMGTITGDARVGKGAFAVADPRAASKVFSGHGVAAWDGPSGAIAGESWPTNGQFCVADPRYPSTSGEYGALGVRKWDEPTGTVSSQRAPGQGGFSVADPRPMYRDNAHKNVFRIIRWDEASQVIGSGHGPSSGGMCVADPRTGYPDSQHTTVMHVAAWDDASRTVTGADHVTGGALSVADPRPGWDRHSGNLFVTDWNDTAHTVVGGGKGVQGGWLSIADPRIMGGVDRGKGENYITSGFYGVNRWDEPSNAVSAAANCDNGKWSVADPRMPEANEKLVAVIRAMDGTWHRPFTTLELAALQSLVDPDDLFNLDGDSDSAKRERIGNAVPPGAAQAIADMMGQTLLMAWSGQTFMLSAAPIWVQPVAIALSVDSRGY